jgi:hypothetical protein
VPAVAPISDPFPVVDLAPLNEGLAEVIPLFGAAVPETVAVLPAGAIVLGGIQIDNYLLRQPWWNNFWIGVGGRLNDVWHSAASHLFGEPSHSPSLDTVQQLIQLSMHVSLRSTRQLVGLLSGHVSSVASRLYKGVIAVANHVNALQAWTGAQLGALRGAITAGDLSVRHYVDARIAQLGAGLDARINLHTSALRAELLRDVLNPLHVDVVHMGQSLQGVHNEVVGIGAQLKTHIVPELAATALIARAAQTMAAAAKAWEDDCGEPMCETVGPKTDWGKLFKRFGPAGLLALLATIEAVDPQAAEDAAKHFAEVIGPVLEQWTTSWLGLVPGNTGDLASEVGHDVGSITL